MKVNVHAGISAFMWTVLLFFALHGTVYSQFSMGASPVSLGHTGTAIPESSWAIFNNPAWLSTEKRSVSFFGYRFAGFAELTDVAIAATLPFSMGTVAIGGHRYGYELYTEQRFTAAVKKRLDRMHTGVSLTYHHISIAGPYGSAGTIGINAGFGIQVTEHLILGARAMNVNRPSPGNSGESLPGELAAGLGFYFSENSFFTADLVKDPNFPPSFRAGLEMSLLGALAIRTGITNQPGSYSFGFGYNNHGWEVNTGIQQHNVLGLSAAMDLIIPF
jgi:hypothetical protein